MSDTKDSGVKRKRVPSVLVDCQACGEPFEVDARTFDLSVELGYGKFRCDDCRNDGPQDTDGCRGEGEP